MATILDSRNLSRNDLAHLGLNVRDQAVDDQWEVEWRAGDRRPRGYVCVIPCTLRAKGLRRAVHEVLERIAHASYEDALRLEDRVLSIDPIEPVDGLSLVELAADRLIAESHPLGTSWGASIVPHTAAPDAVLGRWIPTLGVGSRGRIHMRDERMPLDLARVVFAHECGHAASRGQYVREALKWEEPSDWLAEEDANDYLVKWGLGDLLARVEQRTGIRFPRSLESNIHQH